MGAAAAAIAASSAISAYGSIESGNAARKASEYNAQLALENSQIAQQNATWVGQEGESQAEVQGIKNRAQEGSIKANQAASGIDVNKGSAAKVQESQAAIGALDTNTIRSNAARKAYGYETEAVSDVAQSDLDIAAGKQAQTAGDINAATTILGGTGKAGTAYQAYQMNNSGLGNTNDL